MVNGVKSFKISGLLKNKYALIVLAIGLVLVLFPTGNGKKTTKKQEEISVPQFTITIEEKRLQSRLAEIEDVGEVSVLLSVDGSVSRELAKNGEETLVTSGNGTDDVVEIRYINPTYSGAVVVCEGADSSVVKLSVIEAVSAYTGLSSDEISVNKMAVR